MVYAIFHLPKTGGTTLRSMLTAHCSNGEEWVLNSPIIYYYYAEQFYDVNFMNIRGPCNCSRPLIRSELTDNVKYIMGHLMYYGLHEDLGRPVQYIVFLRNPIGRALSWYNHARIDYKQVHSSTLTFEDWLEQYRCHTMVDDLTCGSSIVDAKQILRECSFIGLQETFEDDVKQLLGSNISVLRRNINSEKSMEYGLDLVEFTEDQLITIKDILKGDEELYEYAVLLRNDGHNNGFGPII